LKLLGIGQWLWIKGIKPDSYLYCGAWRDIANGWTVGGIGLFQSPLSWLVNNNAKWEWEKLMGLSWLNYFTIIALCVGAWSWIGFWVSGATDWSLMISAVGWVLIGTLGIWRPEPLVEVVLTYQRMQQIRKFEIELAKRIGAGRAAEIIRELGGEIISNPILSRSPAKTAEAIAHIATFRGPLASAHEIAAEFVQRLSEQLDRKE
jgi:hypothetical protein